MPKCRDCGDTYSLGLLTDGFCRSCGKKAVSPRVPDVKEEAQPRAIAQQVKGIYSRPLMCEFEKLGSHLGRRVSVEPKAPFDKEALDIIKTMKKCVLNFDSNKKVKPARALKYSAFFKDSHSSDTHTFQLGWDHAMVLRKGYGGWYATAIYAGNYAVGNADTHVFEVAQKVTDLAKVSSEVTMKLPMGKVHAWRKYEIPMLKVSRVITFSLTSCSFACLFDEDADVVVISHMSTNPIPVAWLAREEVKVAKDTPMQLLASLHADPDEQDKFTTTNRFPCADELRITSTLLSRGPLGLDLKHGGDTPSLTHPYIGLDFTSDNTVYCFTALGYNNDPTLPSPEMPPFHSVWSEVSGKLMQSKDAKFIFEVFVDLLNGRYGFATLHRIVINAIGMADRAYTDTHKKPFESDVLDHLLGQTKGGVFSTAVHAPHGLRTSERAMFLLVDLSQNSARKEYEWLLDALLAAWNDFQHSYRFDLDRLDRWT